MKMFKSRQNNFLRLINQQAEITLKGMDLLKAYMQTHVHSIAEEITNAKKEADEVRRILIGGLIGSAERLSKVRWGVAGEIAIAWIITIPATILMAAGVYLVIEKTPEIVAFFGHLQVF